MTIAKTHMQLEALEASARIRDQLKQNAVVIGQLKQRITDYAPRFVVMVGRGSSDHASLFGKYLFEIELGIPVLHAAPSVVSLYGSELKLQGSLVIAISQSGQSPDIVDYLSMARAQGALTLALVNSIPSPLSEKAELVLPMCVGEEKAVAATKSFLGTLSALLQLVSALIENPDLHAALNHLPASLQQVCEQDPQIEFASLESIENCVILGRGFGYAIGMELALKLKEICAIQAECFSSAEFLHGPIRIVSKRFCILDIQVQDESFESHLLQSQALLERGAAVTQLTSSVSVHPRLMPLMIMQRSYLDLESISRAMGYNPDKPEGLQKVTETH